MTGVPMAIITDLEMIRTRAEANADAYAVMGYMLARDPIPDDALDALVDAITEPVEAAIDCTQCANCCRSLDVYLTPDDAARLADGIDVPVGAILADYVARDAAQAVGEWGMFQQSPCAFLAGKHCSVYPHRPETCRTYPALTPDFRWTLADTIQGAGLCPIIFNVLNRMLDVTERLSRQMTDALTPAQARALVTESGGFYCE